MNKNIVALIPTRLNSKRLPGKALLDIDGYPIIVHTAKRAMLSKYIKKVFVCTDSNEIIKVCKKFKIKTIKTKSEFNNYKKTVSFVQKHVSVITFTYSGLMKYKKLKPTPLEKIEDIELLRAIENDMKVYSCEMKESSFSVDVNDDYLKAKIAMSQDNFRGKY